jgi:hypothetical protein
LMDLQDVMKFICRLLMVARQRDKNVHVDLDGWAARPLSVSSMTFLTSKCSIFDDLRRSNLFRLMVMIVVYGY